MRALALLCFLSLALPAQAYDPSAVDRVLRGEDCPGCDLAGADLQGKDLSGLFLVDVTLRGADLSGATLEDTQFDQADLRGAKLAGANLYAASFIRANLDGADLSGALLYGAEFLDASLDGTNLASAELDGALDLDVSKAFGLPVQPAAGPPLVAPALADLRAGSILLVAFEFCPKGTHDADGTSLAVQDNQILYAILGNSHGGNTTAFNLPDLRQQAPLAGLRYCVVMNGGAFPARP